MGHLHWDDSHDGSPASLGYRGRQLVGQVAFYDIVAGTGPGWVGYVHGHPVTERCTERAAAQRSVERTVAAGLPGLPQPRPTAPNRRDRMVR